MKKYFIFFILFTSYLFVNSQVNVKTRGLTKGSVIQAAGTDLVSDGILKQKGRNLTIPSKNSFSSSDTNEIQMYLNCGSDSTKFVMTMNGVYGKHTAMYIDGLKSSRNTGFGYECFGSRTSFSSQFNTAFGYSPLTALTSGFGNTAIGADAMVADTSGYSNTAVGRDALRNCKSGYENVALGYLTLQNLTVANGNVAVGNSSGFSITDGIFNTAIGDKALNGLLHGYYNSAFGEEALQNTLGDQNTGSGARTLQNVNGNGNSALGWLAGENLQTGNYNTFLGYHSTSTGSNNYSNSTAIGSNSVISGSNMIRLGDVNIIHYNLTLATYPNDLSAGLAGLISGDLYQQTTTHIVMIKQ